MTDPNPVDWRCCSSENNDVGEIPQGWGAETMMGIGENESGVKQFYGHGLGQLSRQGMLKEMADLSNSKKIKVVDKDPTINLNRRVPDIGLNN